MTPGRLLLLLAAVVVACAHARASPLDADSCTMLEVEQALLKLAGVERDMAKGPEWAKANLATQSVREIRRFIEVQEQLLFRCRETSPEAGKKTEAPVAAKKKRGRGKKAATRPARRPASRRTRQGPAKPKAKAAAK